MAATSDPPPASVTAMQHRARPRQMSGRYFSLSASLPVQYRCGEAMSVCTPTAMAREPERERTISSQRTMVVWMSATPPPPPPPPGPPRSPLVGGPPWRAQSTDSGGGPGGGPRGPPPTQHLVLVV